MDNHDVTRGSFQEFPPEGAPERPDKRGKTEPQGPEEKITEKTAELAQDIFEDDEDTCAPTSPKLTSLKRARGEKAGEEAGEEAVEGEEPKRKTEKVARKVLPYKSEFPNETNPLVSDVRDRGMQNSIKQAADAFLKSVTDKEIREKVVTLVAKIPADQRAVCMVDLREFLKDVKGEMFKEPIMEEIGQLTPDTLQSSLSWFKSLTSDVRSNKEMCWFLMEIPFKSKELLPLIEQLKPAIRGITDGGVLAGMLRVICEMSREKSLSPGQCEKLITDTKGFLQQVQMLGAQNCEIAGMGPIPESLAISQVVVATVRTFAHVPEEKRTLAVQVASRMLETTKELEDVDLKQELLRGLLFDPAFLSNTTLEEVDNGLLQTQRYLQDFGKETNVGDIFKAFTKVLPDQYADVVEKTNLLLKGCKLPGGTRIGAIITDFAKIPSLDREKFINNVSRILQSVDFDIPSQMRYGTRVPRELIIQTLLNIPYEQREGVIAQVAPLLQVGSRSTGDIDGFLRFATDTEPQKAKDAIERTASFLLACGQHCRGQGYDVLKAIAEIPTKQWEDVQKYAIPVIQLWKVDPNKFNVYTNYASSILKIVADIPEGEREDVLAKAMPLLSTQFVPGKILKDVNALLPTLAAIPTKDERQELVDLANRLQAFGARGFARILRAIQKIDHDQRDHVIESVLFNTNIESTIDDVVFYIKYYNSYEVKIPQEDIEQRPVELLAQLSEQFDQKSAKRLRVIFTGKGEEGLDAGGLGRVFISKLFEVLKNKLEFQVRANGLYEPIAKESPLSDDNKKIYNDIGRLFMFCLNARMDYPIGMIFDPSIFIVLTKFTEDHLLHSIEELVQDPKTFNELFDIYMEKSSSDESEPEALKWMRENKDDPMVKDMMIDIFGPLLAIAKGMNDAPFKDVTFEDVQELSPKKLSKRLQGSLDRDKILDSLEFTDMPDELKKWEGEWVKVQGWVREWIKNADNKKLGQFLFSMTGAPVIGTMDLTVEACEGEVTTFHTCDNILELPVKILDSQEKLNYNLDNGLDTILGSGKFTIE